jgi:hypothetical protein
MIGPFHGLWSWRGALAAFFLAGAVGLATPSCDKAETAFDCQTICDRYKTCFDSTYNVDSCRSNCQNKAANDMDYQRKVDDCEACIDDRSCSSATFSCGPRCIGIVP